MKNNNNNNSVLLTRRDFLRDTAYVSIAAMLGLPILEEQPLPELTKRTKVVLVRDADAITQKGGINTEVIARMLDEAVRTLFDKEDASEAWKSIIKPNDIVGIKSNVWSPLRTPKELEQIIKHRIIDVGVPAENIGIDDRDVLKNRIFLHSTALINIRPLRTHHWSGIGGCIKNYIMFTKKPTEYHDNACANLAAVWFLPIVKNKTRLNILLVLQPLFYGIGPHHFDAKYVWQYKGILVGTDPVALDTVGLRLLHAKRYAYFKEERAVKPPARHVHLADTKFGLGISDIRHIELVKLGWDEELLI